jgi:hypothetical protein
VRTVLKAFTILLETERLAAFAAQLVETCGIGGIGIATKSCRSMRKRRRHGMRSQGGGCSGVRIPRWRHRWITHGKLIVKSGGVTFQDSIASFFDFSGTARDVLTF